MNGCLTLSHYWLEFTSIPSVLLTISLSQLYTDTAIHTPAFLSPHHPFPPLPPSPPPSSTYLHFSYDASIWHVWFMFGVCFTAPILCGVTRQTDCQIQGDICDRICEKGPYPAFSWIFFWFLVIFKLSYFHKYFHNYSWQRNNSWYRTSTNLQLVPSHARSLKLSPFRMYVPS